MSETKKELYKKVIADALDKGILTEEQIIKTIKKQREKIEIARLKTTINNVEFFESIDPAESQKIELETQRENIGIIMDLIHEQSQTIDMIPIDLIIRLAGALGMDSETATAVLTKLKRTGDIYEPRHGYINPVAKR